MKVYNKILTIILLFTVLTSNLIFAESNTTKDAFTHFNPHIYDETNGVWDTTESMNADVGFMKHYDGKVSGFENYIGYVKRGLSFTYKNVYFEKAPTAINVYCGYANFEPYVGRTVNVFVDGQLLASLITEKRADNSVEWDTATTLTADVTGKIAAGSTHDIKVSLASGGTNYFGFQFYAAEPYYDGSVDLQGKSLMSAGECITNNNVYFGNVPLYVGMKAEIAAGTNGTVEVFVDSLNSEPVAVFDINAAASEYGTYTVPVKRQFRDYHNIHIRFNTGGIKVEGINFLASKSVRDIYVSNSAASAEVYSKELCTAENGALKGTNGGYAIFENCDFNKAPWYIKAKTSASADAVIQVRMDSADGEVLAEIKPSAMDNSIEEAVMRLNSYQYGMHNVYFMWQGDVTLYDFTFMRKEDYNNPHDVYNWSELLSDVNYEKSIVGNTKQLGRYKLNGLSQISYISNGDVICFENYSFDNTTKYAMLSIGGTIATPYDIELRLDSADGELIAAFGGNLRYNSVGYGESIYADIKKEITGTHNIYVCFKCDGISLFGLQFFGDNIVDLKREAVDKYDYSWEYNGVKYYAYNGLYAGEKPQKYVVFTPADKISATGRFTLTLNSSAGSTLMDARTSKNKFVGNMSYRDEFSGLCALVLTDSAGTYNYNMRFSDTNISFEDGRKLVTIFTDGAQNGTVVVCAYKEDKVVKIKTCSLSLTKKSYFDVLLDDEFLSGADTLRVFAVKDMVNIIPLYESGIYELPKGEKL